MLAPVYALTGLSPLALKLPGLLLYIGFLLFYFLLIRTRLAPTESLLAVSLFAFNPGFLLFLDNIISDIPFLCLSTLGILVANLYTRETQEKKSLALAALAGFAIFAAFFVRTQGLVLLGSLLLYQGVRFLRQRDQRQRLIADSLVILAVFGIFWSIASLIFPGGQSSYLSLYRDFTINTLTGNILNYSKLFSEFFAGLPGQALVFAIFVLFFLIGLAARFQADLLFVLYIGLYLLVVWSWPEWQGYRFLFPILPFFVYFSLQGVGATLKKLNQRQGTVPQKTVYVFLMLIVAFFVYKAGLDAFTNLRADRTINGPFDPYSTEIYDFIKNNTSPESVIIFFKPRAMRLMTGHDSLALTECERLPEGDYLVLSKKVGENLQIPPEQIDACNLPLDKLFENRRFVVYRVVY